MEQRTREQALDTRAVISPAASEDGRLREIHAIDKWLWILPIVVASVVFAGTMVAPPHLMDDVDGVQAQIARNMLVSGDWVTPRLNGIVNFEKPPLLYWMSALCYSVFGVSDWAARLPVVGSAVALCALVSKIGTWAFGCKPGVIAGVCLATSVGLFIFSRVQFHDIPLALAMTVAMWAALRALENDERRPKVWAALGWACLAIGILVKGLIGFILPIAAMPPFSGLDRQIAPTLRLAAALSRHWCPDPDHSRRPLAHTRHMAAPTVF